MKKSTLVATATVIILAVLGGGIFFANRQAKQGRTNTAYNSAMTNGKTAVVQKHYDAAMTAFNQAYSIKATPLANTYASQAEHMATATADLKRGAYQLALSAIKRVLAPANGYSLLRQQARTLKSSVLSAKDNYEHEIKPLMENALKAENKGSYQAAVGYYQQVLALPYITGSAYRRYLAEAKQGLKDAKAQADSNDASDNSSSSSSNSSSNSSASSKTKNTKKQKIARNKQPKTPVEGKGATTGDQKVQGKTVDSTMVEAIRKQLNQLGFYANSWSPQDIINLYRQAAANGHTQPSQITAEDVRNWLQK